MEIKELGHVVLYVRSLARSATFYGEVLGWQRVVSDRPLGFPAAAFTSGRTHHELLLIEVGEDATPAATGRRVGLYHIGLKIGDTDEELRAALARLRELGVPVVGMSDHKVTHSVYILDPDGNELELYIDVAGVEWAAENLLTPPQALAL
ncbi:MAG TPA: VOC family protein [Candidatus Dormibacteraeota bacterium]|nr:VOC family protein [Candidatus Dormibacteraeota bacterium]